LQNTPLHCCKITPCIVENTSCIFKIPPVFLIDTPGIKKIPPVLKKYRGVFQEKIPPVFLRIPPVFYDFWKIPGGIF